MKPEDYIIIILTSVVLVVTSAPVIRTLLTGVPITDKGAQVMGDIQLAVLAIIALYIGAKIGK